MNDRLLDISVAIGPDLPIYPGDPPARVSTALAMSDGNAANVSSLCIGVRRGTHILLGKGILVLEGLRLEGVPAGDYQLVCLPLKLSSADGAPARAWLFAE